MEEYTAMRCNGLPDWSEIPAVSLDYALQKNNANVSAQAQLCYDDTAFYLRLSAQEAHIRAELTGTPDEVCEDSCLEFFFRPVSDDPRYINIECNPNGCLYVGIGTNIETLTRLNSKLHPITPIAKRISGGWETVYSVPFHFICQHFPSFSPRSGDCIRANFYKCGDLTVIPHYLSWNPVPMQPFAFHNPDCFGTIRYQ